MKQLQEKVTTKFIGSYNISSPIASNDSIRILDQTIGFSNIKALQLKDGIQVYAVKLNENRLRSLFIHNDIEKSLNRAKETSSFPVSIYGFFEGLSEAQAEELDRQKGIIVEQSQEKLISPDEQLLHLVTNIPTVNDVFIPITYFVISPDNLSFYGISAEGILSYFDHISDYKNSSRLQLIRTFNLNEPRCLYSAIYCSNLSLVLARHHKDSGDVETVYLNINDLATCSL